MFKSKKSLYILLPINLLVWGFIGWKIIAAFQGEDVPLPADNMAAHSTLTDKDTITYQLALNYDDPFLKQEPARRVNTGQNGATSNPSTAAPRVPKPPVEVKPQRDIKYLGTIQNKTSGKTMALISVNGNSYNIKKGDAVDGMTVKDITASYIEVKEGNKVFRISK